MSVGIRQKEWRIWNSRPRSDREKTTGLFHGDKTEQTITSRSQRIVASVMKAWDHDIKDFCCMKDWPVGDRWKQIQGKEMCDEICSASADELREAMRVFRNKNCLLGLVLIAGLQEGDVRDEAIRSLRGVLFFGLGGNRALIAKICSLVPVKENWHGRGTILEGYGGVRAWKPLPAELMG